MIDSLASLLLLKVLNGLCVFLSDEGMDESSSQELLEEKLKDVIDATTQKR